MNGIYLGQVFFLFWYNSVLFFVGLFSASRATCENCDISKDIPASDHWQVSVFSFLVPYILSKVPNTTALYSHFVGIVFVDIITFYFHMEIFNHDFAFVNVILDATVCMAWFAPLLRSFFHLSIKH